MRWLGIDIFIFLSPVENLWNIIIGKIDCFIRKLSYVLIKINRFWWHTRCVPRVFNNKVRTHPGAAAAASSTPKPPRWACARRPSWEPSRCTAKLEGVLPGDQKLHSLVAGNLSRECEDWSQKRGKVPWDSVHDFCLFECTALLSQFRSYC